MAEPPRILIIAPQWLGDAIMAAPLLALLAARYAGSSISVAAPRALCAAFAAMPMVGEILLLDFARGQLQWHQRLAFARTLKGRFDRAYVLPNSFKAALLPWLARIPKRIGYRGEWRDWLLTQCLPNPRREGGERAPMVPFYARLANEPGEPLPASLPAPQLRIAASERDAAMATFAVQPGRYWLLAPGAEYGSAKRWPPEHFAALARDLAASAPVLILGSAKEAALGEAIARMAACGAACRSLAGQTDLAQALALIAGSRALISNDSGLMHAAAALGIAQVALFGSSSPRHTPPLNAKARVLWLKEDGQYQPPLDCAPCFARECRYGHTRCLRDIAPARVLAALRTICDITAP